MRRSAHQLHPTIYHGDLDKTPKVCPSFLQLVILMGVQYDSEPSSASITRSARKASWADWAASPSTTILASPVVCISRAFGIRLCCISRKFLISRIDTSSLGCQPVSTEGNKTGLAVGDASPPSGEKSLCHPFAENGRF